MEKVNITLHRSNGTIVEIKNATQNGSCYIIDKKIDNIVDETFDKVIIGDEEIKICTLVQVGSTDGKFWFTFSVASEDEIRIRKLESKIEYIAMMNDINMEV